MACPIHPPPHSTTPDGPEYPSDSCVRYCKQNPEECHQHPQCLDSGVQRAVVTDDSSQQGPGAVHWPTPGNEHEAVDHGSGACHVFYDSSSTDSQPFDTPSSSSDEEFGTSCLSPRDATSQGSDMITVSEDGSTTGASSGHADTPSDAIRERFLACDDPWSTYNRRLELPASDYNHYHFSTAIYDDDDDYGNVG